MDLEILCKSLEEAKDTESRLEIINDIKITVARLGITFHDIQKFFGYLNNELLSKESAIILAVTDTLLEIINTDTPEVEPQLPMLFKSLISHFEDSEVRVREATLNVMLQYIRRTRNIENVLVQYNKYGITSPNVTVRRKSIKYLPVIIETEKNVFATQTGIYEMRKTIENVIMRLKDESELVQKEAEKTLWLIWKSYKSFEKIIPKLAIEHQTTFENRITIIYENQAKLNPELVKRKLSLTNIPEVQRIVKLDVGLLELKAEEVSPEKKRIILPVTEQWPVSKNGLYFGFISANELKGLTTHEDWKKRLVSAEAVEEKLLNFKDFFDLNAYLTSFVNFLKTLLDENHQPILVSLYNILNRVLDVPGCTNKIALHSLLPELIPKLADSRVALRQECLGLCARICQMMKLEVALAVLIKNLDFEQNWHMKEEILKLIIVCYLNTHVQRMKIESDQELILARVAPLVEDENSKVRLAALETLTVICYSTNTTTTLEMLERFVDRDAYEIVIDGLSQGQIAYVGGQSNVIDFTREKYQYLLEKQKERSENSKLNYDKGCKKFIGFLAEVRSKDAQMLHDDDPDFDWQQFEMKDQDEEGSEASALGSSVAKELVKDPKLNLPKRLKASLRGKGLAHQKQYVQVVDLNADTYKDYEYAGKGDNDPNLILFTKDIPESQLQTLTEKDDEEEEEEIEEAPAVQEEEKKEEEKVDRDPLEILDDIFDNGQGYEKEDLPLDKKKLIGELKHVKRKKKNKKEIYEEHPNDPQEDQLLADENLKPLSFADFYLDNILLDLRIDDESLQFEAVNNLRRVCLHSPEALYNQKFSIHVMIKQLLVVFQATKKSILMRNVMLVLKPLFERLAKILDVDIDDIINMLLDKTFKEELTQRTFMEMKYCLGSMIHHLSSDRIIVALARFLSGTTTQGQIMVLLCIEKVIGETSIQFSSYKGAGVLLKTVVKNMSHKVYQLRTVARRAFYKLVESGYERKELERLFKEAVTQEEYRKFMEFMQRTDALREKNIQKNTQQKKIK